MKPMRFSEEKRAAPPEPDVKPPCVVCGTGPRFGVLSRCRNCLGEQVEADRRALAENRARAQARADAEAIAAGRVKACATCRATKPMTAFPKSARARDGRRKSCADCIRANKAKRRKARNPGKRTTPESLAQHRASVRDWRRRNPEAYRACQALNRAIRKGVIARPARCQVQGCESLKTPQAHHPDYRLPLVAAFLCPEHHRRLHAGESVQLIEGLPEELTRIPHTESLAPAA